MFQSEYKTTELSLQLQNARDDAENDERRRQRKLADSDERKQQLQEKVCTSAVPGGGGAKLVESNLSYAFEEHRFPAG